MFLYRRLGLAVIVLQVFFLASVVWAVGQGTPQLKRRAETPEEKPPEVKKPKKGKDPRAVGLLQLNSSGNATLIPIAILIDGKFHDASVYKANPVPMALESGTVYEAEQAGDSQGLFTVSGALHSKTAGSAHPWVGAGSYMPKGSEVATTTHKAEDVPVGLNESGDEPPRLTRGKGSKGTGSAKTAPAATSSNPTSSGGESGSSDKTTAKPPGSSDQAPSSDKAAKSSTAAGSSDKATPPSSSDKDKDKGVAASNSAEQAKPGAAPTSAGGAAGEQTSKGGASDAASQSQESQNYYRPTLRRGKPTQPAPEEEEASAKSVKPGSATAGSPGSATAGPSSAAVQLVPAISDAGGPDPRPYKFFWKEGEEAERRTQMLALAADEVRAYGNTRAKGMIAAKAPASAKSGAPARKAKATPAEPVFENVQFRGFDVWVNNQPVMILSAEAHVPPAPGAAAAPDFYSITLVARTDIYGNLRKLYSGVTDKFHLDVTPRLELIDAVDADGDGRGELLFRETTDAGSGYVIYRATADKLWKMFDSLEE
jgi:hypothetical protein